MSAEEAEALVGSGEWRWGRACRRGRQELSNSSSTSANSVRPLLEGMCCKTLIETKWGLLFARVVDQHTSSILAQRRVAVFRRRSG